MADGAARPGTVCTLSHWPATPTPVDWQADLSAEIALRALADPGKLPPGVEVATVDHYDEDGLVTLALLCDPILAETHGARLVEVARVGDFGVVRDRAAARVAFALNALEDSELSSCAELRGLSRPADPLQVCGLAATAGLKLLPDLLGDPGSFKDLWGPQDAAYEATLAALRDGSIRIDEYPACDLAVVDLDGVPRQAAWQNDIAHRAAIHSATRCLRILTVVANRYELRYRYESWVRLVSREVRPRVDLTALASELSALENDGASWVFDGAGAVRGALHLLGPEGSSLPVDQVISLVVARLKVLDAGPPAWNPNR
jgi:hypothetical protein